MRGAAAARPTNFGSSSSLPLSSLQYPSYPQTLFLSYFLPGQQPMKAFIEISELRLMCDDGGCCLFFFVCSFLMPAMLFLCFFSFLVSVCF